MIKKILILAANPKSLSPLRLEQEVRDIEEGLERSKERDQFTIVKKTAVRPRDFRRALMDEKPQIVHFCGHGLEQKGIALENEIGQTQLVSARALSSIFSLFASYVKCVVLNACFSEEQADAICKHVDYVVGMKQEIGGQAAIEFSVAFYDALASEDNALSKPQAVEFAYKLGCVAIDMIGVEGALTPIFLKRMPKSDISNSNPEILEVSNDHSQIILKSTLNPERVSSPSKVFISHRSQVTDIEIYKEFKNILSLAGHYVFMPENEVEKTKNWSQEIISELENCDYFILFLSADSVASEMTLEEVRLVTKFREIATGPKPIIIPIRLNFPSNIPLHYELRSHLDKIQEYEWNFPESPDRLLKIVLNIIADKKKPPTAITKNLVNFDDNNPDTPPLPVAEPELYREPGGTVPLVSELYVERPPIETDCYKEILQPGALIRIKAPRQMGKTSLMARILDHARSKGCQVVSLSFQRADSTIFSDLNKLLYWFAEQVGRRLKLLEKIDLYWSRGAIKDKCHFYFEECLLESSKVPLVLAIDEVDRVFPHRQVADDFFALLRSWFEAARIGDYSSELWKKLRLVIVHSTEVYVPLDINQSPFNVGTNIELPEFNEEQVQSLSYRYGLSYNSNSVKQLMELIGGHPYLIRKAFYHLRKKDFTLEKLLETAPTEAGIYSDHLRRHLFNLQQYPELERALHQIVVKNKPTEIDAESAFKLDSMGLIRLNGNEAGPRYNLYTEYFSNHLGSQKI